MARENSGLLGEQGKDPALTDGNQNCLNGDSSNNKKPMSLFTIAMLLRVADFLAIFVSGFISLFLLGERISSEILYLYTNLVFLGAVFAPVVINWTGGYDVQACFSLRKSWKRALTGILILASLLLAVGFSFKFTATFSRVWFGSWLIESSLGIALLRFGIVALARRARSQGSFDSRVIIVGAGKQGQRLCNFIKQNKKLTMNVIGFVDDRTDRTPQEVEGIPFLGGVQNLVRIIREGHVDQVFVSLPGNAEQRIREVIDYIAETPIKIRLAPDIAVFQYLDRPFTSLGGLPVITLFDRPISGINRIIKTTEDYVLGTVTLALVSPLMLIIAAAIKIDSRGPVFFRQQREGFNNRSFGVWKFRSMQVESSAVNNILQATIDDPRVTKVGAFLRRTSLDELPQLFNVLSGDMSLVGPRPHAPSTEAGGVRFEEAVARYARRHKVKPGITGWAQINGWRGETRTIDALDQRLQHDLYYIDHWSLGFDIRILFLTLIVVWRQDQAY